ncbi:MAG TPA: dienelactone hydrolase family protein [Nitrospirota bacterium]|nr:dienelactone hydrolase family protein [Nitrospirota bacterium]
MFNTLTEQKVSILAGTVMLEGNLVIPRSCRSVVIFAHGSGSSMHSPRNRFVAGMLQEEGIGTLLFDLLKPFEDAVYANRFNIDLLTERLKASTHWLQKRPETQGLPLGYFGASTGSAAALRAAAEMGPLIRAVVSRGGRPDLAGPALSRVTTPVLFIVGGNDSPVLELNQQAYGMITADKDLAIVPHATHLFEEPGALAEVARLAVAWFRQRL